MQEELITVIVPIYNMEKYLERCMNSIRGQTYRNLEILMIDDGSTDQTAEIADEIAGQDSRIQVFHLQNHGSSAARNFGIEHAHGAYYSFIDSDDYIEPQMYEKLYQAVTEYRLPMAQGGRDEIDEQGKRLADICTPPPQTCVMKPHDFMRELLLHKGDCSFCTRITRSSLFEHFRFPEGALNEDFHVMVQMLPQLAGVVSIPDRVYHVFYKSESNTRTASASSFSRVYSDNVDNAEMVLSLVKKEYPDLVPVAVRFGLYQRLDYLLHVPIAAMNRENSQYIRIVQYLKKNRSTILHCDNLTKKNKQYLILFSIAPRLIRQIHYQLRMKNRTV
jgi:glycosyltransferase involved in cell wall biosynthesis